MKKDGNFKMTPVTNDTNVANGQAAGTILIDAHQFVRRLMSLSFEHFPENIAFELTDLLDELRNSASKLSTMDYRTRCPIPAWDRRETITAGLGQIWNTCDELFDDFRTGETPDAARARALAARTHRCIKKILGIVRRMEAR